MTDRESHAILVVDLRHDRGDLLRVLLEPLGSVVVSRLPPRPEEPPPALVVIDPPPPGLAARRWKALRRTLPDTPVLLLGAHPEPAPEPSDRVLTLAGPLLPSRVRAAAAELLRLTPPPRLDWLHALASCLPIDEDASAILGRAAGGRVPVLLTGEPGTGKSLLARAHLTRPGGRFRRIELATSPSLAEEVLRLPRGATLYLSGLEDLTAPGQLDLLEILEEVPDSGLQIVLGAGDGDAGLEGLRDDLRLRIGIVTLGFRPLRLQAEAVPELFARTLAALGVRHELEPPSLAPGLAPVLAAHPWPLNFDELIAVATRCLLAASGRVAEVEDLGLPAGRRAAGIRPRARPRPSRPADTRSPGSFDVLAADLAHEIKNPLVSIQTFAQLLPERYDDPEFREEFHRMVTKDIARIDGVLDEITHFARLREPVFAGTDPARLVRKMLASQEGILAKAAVEVQVNVPDRAPAIETDAELLGYALDTSLRQALETIRQPGRIEVTLTPGSLPRGKGTQIVFRYRTGRDDRSLRGEMRAHRREVLGLRHTLAAHVLAVLGARLEIDDTLEGDTVISIAFQDRP